MLNTKKPIERINFSKIKKVIDIPDLIEVQKQSYAEFLQQDVPEDKRKFQGLEEVFREIFPITDFNDTSVHSILELLSLRFLACITFFL